MFHSVCGDSSSKVDIGMNFQLHPINVRVPTGMHDISITIIPVLLYIHLCYAHPHPVSIM